MYEVRAIASFDHHGSRKAGDRFTVGNQRQVEELEKKGLVEVLGGAVHAETNSEAAATGAGGAATGTHPAATDLNAGNQTTTGGKLTSPTPGEQLVDGNASDVIAALVELQDKSVLQSALDAEKAGKDRKTVVEALEAALKAD